jgi:hypothetical protein
MEARDDVYRVIEQTEEQAVGETPQPSAMHIAKDRWERQRVCADAGDLLADRSPELSAETAGLARIRVLRFNEFLGRAGC